MAERGGETTPASSGQSVWLTQPKFNISSVRSPTPTPRLAVFEDRTSEEVTKMKWSHRDGALVRWDQWPC